MIIKGAKHSLAAKTVVSKKSVKKVEEPAAAPAIEEEILFLEEEEDLDLKPNRYKNVKILPLKKEDEDFSFNIDID